MDAASAPRRASSAPPPANPIAETDDQGDGATPSSVLRAAALPKTAAARSPSEPRFPSSPASRAFRRRFYPAATPREWADWRWQVRNRIRTPAELERIFELSESERAVVAGQGDQLPLGITPYYASLMSRTEPTDPLRRTHLPVLDELALSRGEAADPLGEDHDTVVPGLVHRYPDRVLLLVTRFCNTYCRYCTRSRLVGNQGGQPFGTSHWDAALAYVASHPEIRDVLISGGDALTLSDDKLDGLLGRLRRIPHVEYLRIGTKVPAVNPMRITRELTRMLRRHHPLWMSIHFTHPAELTVETSEACARLADAGIPLGSQTVLLAGINDRIDVLKPLMQGLVKRRVKPYYLYQCDPVAGTAHFRTSVEKGLELIRGLRGHTSGYCVPTFVVDAPGGGGKIPLLPDYVAGREGDDLLLRNFEGNMYRYPDPGGTLGSGGTDAVSEA